MNTVDMNETPKFLLRQPTNKIHAIVLDEPYVETPMVVPLSINSVTSYFPCQKPTRSKFEDCDVPRIYFTEEAPDWDPLDQELVQR